MNQSIRARFGIAILIVAIVAVVFPRPASAIISILNGSAQDDLRSGGINSSQSNLLQVTVTGTPPTAVPSDTPIPTVQSGFVRPQIAVRSYRTNPGEVQYGQDFKLIFRLRNEGQVHASNDCC